MFSGRASFLCRSVARGSLFRENDAHDASGFYVPEHLGYPEFFRLDDDDRLFRLVRLAGVFLFWFWLPAAACSARAISSRSCSSSEPTPPFAMPPEATEESSTRNGLI